MASALLRTDEQCAVSWSFLFGECIELELNKLNNVSRDMMLFAPYTYSIAIFNVSMSYCSCNDMGMFCVDDDDDDYCY